MTAYIVLETADSLLYSYELLALRHRKNEHGKHNYNTTFPLLILNASIVEGILRYWLANSIKETMDGIFAAVPYCIDLIGGPYVETNEAVIKAFRPKRSFREG